MEGGDGDVWVSFCVSVITESVYALVLYVCVYKKN